MLMSTNNHTTNLVKVCSVCSEQKSIEYFPENGKGTKCKSCRYISRKEYYSSYSKKYYENNKDVIKPRVKANMIKWHSKNPQYRNEYHKQRKANDPAYRLLCNLRNRIQDVLKKTATGKTIRTKETFGCPLEEVVKHIESQFKEGMSWENYGLYTWHIDHIKPLTSFDLSNPEEVKKANHYTNLQPLWAKDNISKRDKF